MTPFLLSQYRSGRVSSTVNTSLSACALARTLNLKPIFFDGLYLSAQSCVSFHWRYIPLDIYLYVCMYVNIYVCTYIHIRVYMCVCRERHTHTYIHVGKEDPQGAVETGESLV